MVISACLFGVIRAKLARSMTIGRAVLVVDDVHTNLIAMEAALEPLSLEVVTASSGREAVAHLLERDFALILLDVQMPEMDGYETAEWIRSRERTRHVPIIFVTAHDHNHDSVLRAYRIGAVDFLYKPVDVEVIRAKVQAFVRLADAYTLAAQEPALPTRVK